MCFNVLTTMYLGFQGITFVNCLYRLNFNIYFGLFHSKNAWVTIFQKKKICILLFRKYLSVYNLYKD